MEIGIIGGTRLALYLGDILSSRANIVHFGVRQDFEAKGIEWKILKMSPGKVSTYKEVIEESVFLLICCENEYLYGVAEELAEADLSGKIIIDCTNAIYADDTPCNTDVLKLAVNEGYLFKAFNNLGLDYPLTDPMGLVKETYFCGPDIPEKKIVSRLIATIGFKGVDAGGLENARLLEAVYHLRKEISLQKNENLDYHFKLIGV
ncbi:hypothetical protein A33Q_0321 [Indibacter alkaliphilus LW1]|jgi:predicted dinucleotide-binding enzyme|uniref:Pyrroline-5-carboxylate reductase catalytic N-terminal domain-containing protein n=1 Tax=Indibacter alkaliphilus (strain CCUG 57479 / KCTC 22604 / LW1) TaxID=1189612 RepID=S2DQW2_INDAL|nr:NAD(P)-binding domain-containing protein [Indibacter alkaliphilus]EOZ99640.1 hypothetical protein A33Q_0321 [Indibacter alkaliphilus LW1]